MAKYNINDYNALIDKSKTVLRMGRNGILYEYLLPTWGNPMYYYEDAIDVKSHKSATTKYDNGKQPGMYQPIGDKRFFTYYQLNKMTPEELWEFAYQLYAEKRLQAFINLINGRGGER